MIEGTQILNNSSFVQIIKNENIIFRKDIPALWQLGSALQRFSHPIF